MSSGGNYLLYLEIMYVPVWCTADYIILAVVYYSYNIFLIYHA